MKNLIPPQIDIHLNRKRIYKILFLFIVLSSFLLSIYKSIPFTSVDERMIANWIWAFHDNPFPVNQYPPLFLYLHFILSLVYQAIFLLIGIIKTGYEFVNTGFGYNFMIEAGRFVSAIFGMLMLYYIYRIGKEFYNRSVAFASTLIVAFNGVFILHNHIFKSDILVSFLITVSLFFLLKFHEYPEKKWIFLFSFFFGLSFAAKYNIAVFFIVILFALIIHRNEVKIFQSIKVFILGSFLGFIVSSPNWIINPIGNIKKLVDVYNFKKGSVYIQDLSPFSIYSNFITDIVNQFGILLTVVLFVGIVIAFLKKSKKDMLLALFLIIYILFFGLTGFYGRRFLLPIYSVIALLIGKTIFIDFIDVFKKKRSQNLIRVILFIPILFFVTNDVINNLKKFNMLNLESKYISALKYREGHNLNDRKFIFASQFMTPGKSNDIRFKKSFKIKRFFKKRGKPEFLQVNAGALKNLSDLNKIKKVSHINILDYRPFYKIKREKIQDWDNDILFFYKTPKDLIGIKPTITDINLPKMYLLNTGDAFYPVQRYEKYPGFMKSKSGYCFSSVHSGKKIIGFNFSIFSLNKITPLTIKINGIEKVLPQSEQQNYVRKIHVSNISEKRINYQFVYNIEVYAKKKFKSSIIHDYSVVYEPEYEQNNSQKSFYKMEMVKGINIPAMFNKGSYPEWIKEFFKDTSIDLVLYNLVNTIYLDGKLGENLTFNESSVFPIAPGDYIIELFVENIINRPIVGENAVIQYDIFSVNGKSSGSLNIKNANQTTYPLHVESQNGPVFVKLRFKHFKESNLLLKKVSVKPDFIKYFQNRYKK